MPLPETLPRPDWRAAERELFRRLDGLMQGHPPATGPGEAEARRSGYLAELAALRLGAPNRRDLLAWASGLRHDLEKRLGPAENWTVIAAVPGGIARTPAGLDELAGRWGICPGVDPARFIAERHALSPHPQDIM